MNGTIADELRLLAEQERKAGISALPLEVHQRLLVFIEATRVVDYRSVFQSLLPPERRMAAPDLELVQTGWNQVAAHCLTPAAIKDQFPLAASTPERAGFAIALLHQFGRSAFVRRLADMVECGLVTPEPTSSGYRLYKSDPADSQFLDVMEFARMRAFHSLIKGSRPRSYKDWEVCEHAEPEELRSRPGAFFSHLAHGLESWRHPDIDSAMRPLVRPWPTPAGVMMAYDAVPEVDNHFLAATFDYIDECRNAYGIHPETVFDATTGTEITAVTAAVVSFHLKHIKFAELGMSEHEDIVVEQSLTAWSTRDTLVSGLADWMGLSEARVDSALDAITLRASEAAYLGRLVLPQIPLLVSLENNILVRPVSSVVRNPLIATFNLLASRNAETRDALRGPREDWLRRDLYSLFYGSRYFCVGGNVTLRADGKTVTDVDAAVLDQTSGHMAFFQLKWQDFFTCDVRELRSRSSNLVREIDDWATKVTGWLRTRSAEDIERTFRISPKSCARVTAVWLFALSRTAARVQGYGFTAKHPKLAVANWPHFSRIRRDVGPVEAVIPKIHAVLQAQSAETVETTAIPAEWSIAGKTIRVEDIWSALPGATEGGIPG